MASDDGIVGLIIGSPLIVLALYVLYSFYNVLDNTPQYQALQPSAQTTMQNIQNHGGQAVVLADPTLIEVVVVIVGAIAGIVGLIVVLARR